MTSMMDYARFTTKKNIANKDMLKQWRCHYHRFRPREYKTLLFQHFYLVVLECVTEDRHDISIPIFIFMKVFQIARFTICDQGNI